jgi:ribose transport system substrate-binding protein
VKERLIAGSASIRPRRGAMAVLAALGLVFLLVLTLGDRGAAQAAGTAVTPANLAKARAAAAAESKSPTSIGITTPLAKRPKPGTLSVCYLSFLTVPVVGTNTSGLEDGAKALGVKIYKYDLGATADTQQTALNAALNQKCDGYWVSGGIAVATWKKQAAVLKQRGVPVVSQGDTWPNTGKNLNYYSVAGVGETGSKLFDYALAQENGKPVNMVVVSPPAAQFKVFAGTYPYTKAEAARLCPMCKVTVLYLPSTAQGTTAPSQVVSYLQGHPDVNWVMGLLDMNIGLPSALKAAGLSNRVKLEGFVGGATELGYVKKGQEVADLQYANVTQGWLTLDALVRGMTGQSMAPDQAWQASTQIETPKNVRIAPTGFWAGIPGNAQKFYKLWGCSPQGVCPGVKQ